MCTNPVNGTVLTPALKVTLNGMVEPATLLTGIGSNAILVAARFDTVKDAEVCSETMIVLGGAHAPRGQNAPVA
jgi:hypothetical protein